MTKATCVAVSLTALLLCQSAHAGNVAIRFDVPAGLELYTGRQPVTFGVPFPEGVLRVSDHLRLTRADGSVAPGQFEVTARWTPDSPFVRWLLIDCFADIVNGQAQPLTLSFGAQVQPDDTPALHITEQSEQQVTVDTGAGRFTLGRDGGSVGDFLLRTGANEIFRASLDTATSKVEVERHGPVRTVLKWTGHYVDAAGEPIAEHITRLRLYAGSATARLYHTMIWLRGPESTIAEVTFLTPERNGAFTLHAGVDGQTITATSKVLALQQTDWNQVTGSATGEHLDGWIAADHGNTRQLLALRWPWQQYPTQLHGSTTGQLGIRLIGPTSPMSLRAEDVAVPAVQSNIDVWNLRIFREGVPGNDVVWNGKEARPHISPRGVARTWEILLSHDPDATPAQLNTLAQHPVLGFADPAFAVQAQLPSPAAPVDDARHGEIETALRSAFGFYTRQDQAYGDYGVWNWGDLQWTWTYNGFAIYRYWMNHGKGWSILPWALWLRSGERQYWENGEANSRHCMDVDICHIPGWERDPNDYKLRGGQYHYSALHWGYGPQVFTFFIDSEYLPYAWYMTGYERAHDVMLEHAEALARWQARDGWMKHFHDDPRANAGRHLYVMLKNLCVLYEATWDQRLLGLADEVLELMRQAQFDSGNFPHVKTNHYLDEPLCIAVRVFGWERVGPMLTKWVNFLGDSQHPGPTGAVSGPMSPWSAVLVAQHANQAQWRDSAQRVMNTLAQTVVTDPGPWQGLNSIPAHEAGPALRDWPITLAALQAAGQPRDAQAFMPMAGVFSNFTVPQDQRLEGYSNFMHVAAVLEDQDAELTLQLAFVDRPATCTVRVLRPDGSAALEQTHDLSKRTVSYEGEPLRLTIPSDGQHGVYLLELRVAGKENYSATVHLTSSTGKVVHWAGDGRRAFVSGIHGGQFVVRPRSAEAVSISFPLAMYIQGRTVLLDDAGKAVGASVVTQDKPFTVGKNPMRYAVSVPWGDPCRAQGLDPQRLYTVVLPDSGDWHRPVDLTGFSPWISLTAGQWFDPVAYPHPDLSSYH